MPAAVVAAAIAAGGTATTAVIGSRAQTGAQRRALQAQRDADTRAEAQLARQEAAEQARWEAEQEQRRREFDAAEAERTKRLTWEEEDRQYLLDQRKAAEEARAQRAAYDAQMAPIYAAEAEKQRQAQDARLAPLRQLRSNALNSLGGLLQMGTPGYRGTQPNAQNLGALLQVRR